MNVEEVAPETLVKLMLSGLSCHWYANCPDPPAIPVICMARCGVPEQKVIGVVPDVGVTDPAVIEVTVIPALAVAVHPRASVVVTE